MKILAIESSAVTASVALSEDEQILASEFTHSGLTHSQTLLPMVERVLETANCSVSDIDLFAVTNGPGSFTGVRIGVATVKGLSFPEDKHCIGISTLEVIAANVESRGAIAIACMDARREQVYTAAFESCTLKRLSEDEALGLDVLAQRIAAYKQPVVLCGDGAKLAYDFCKKQGLNPSVLGGESKYQNAQKLCVFAYKNRENAVQSAALMPTYLRPSQAERELKRKRGITL